MENFLFFVFVLVLLGILKDVLVLAKRLEDWIKKKFNGGYLRSQPASLEVLNALMKEYVEYHVSETDKSLNSHFDALIMESRKTNELLTKFLIGQKIIAKSAHGIDL